MFSTTYSTKKLEASVENYIILQLRIPTLRVNSEHPPIQASQIEKDLFIIISHTCLEVLSYRRLRNSQDYHPIVFRFLCQPLKSQESSV